MCSAPDIEFAADSDVAQRDWMMANDPGVLHGGHHLTLG